MALLNMEMNHALNFGLAMMLCCNANTLKRMILIRTAFSRLGSTPESIVFGTNKLPTKPMAYKNATRKIQ